MKIMNAVTIAAFRCLAQMDAAADRDYAPSLSVAAAIVVDCLERASAAASAAASVTACCARAFESDAEVARREHGNDAATRVLWFIGLAALLTALGYVIMNRRKRLVIWWPGNGGGSLEEPVKRR